MTDERRIADLERTVGRLEERAEQVPVLGVEMRQVRSDLGLLRDEVKSLAGDVKGLRGNILAFAFTVAAGTIGLVITMIVTTQQ